MEYGGLSWRRTRCTMDGTASGLLHVLLAQQRFVHAGFVAVLRCAPSSSSSTSLAASGTLGTLLFDTTCSSNLTRTRHSRRRTWWTLGKRCDPHSQDIDSTSLRAAQTESIVAAKHIGPLSSTPVVGIALDRHGRNHQRSSVFLT